MKTKHIVGVVMSVGLLAVSATTCLAAGDRYKIRGKGYVAVADCRAKGCADDYAEGTQKIREIFGIAVSNVTMCASFDMAKADGLLKQSGGNVAVFIVDDPVLPMTLTASEACWALVNVAKIDGADVSPKTFARRLSLLVTREICRVLGGDEAKGTDTCFHAVLSAGDLDDITSFDITMGPELAVNDAMGARGIERYEYGDYEMACEEGVAPAPRNDEQKAIWEKFKAEANTKPSNPMKITKEKK